MKKRQLTIGEAIMAVLLLTGAILTAWITNVQAISTLQTKQEDDRSQVQQFQQDIKERLTRIENKIDRQYEKQAR